MNTQITASQVYTMLGGAFSSFTTFKPALNQVLNRFILGGKWKGQIASVLFDNSDGFITLPYEYLSVIGAQWFGAPIPTFTQFHGYIESGPGHLDPTKPASGILEDLGDGYCTNIDPPSAYSTIRIVLDLLIDVGKQFRFYGDSNGRQIFDVFGQGMNIVTTGLTTNEGTVFDTVTGIECPVDANGDPSLIGGWTLYAVAPDGTATKLSYYYPTEIRPAYRRYKTGTTDKAIRVLCQRRFIPVFKETDWVIPGNVGAIKQGLQAINFEDANSREDLNSWDKAYALLNQEAHALRGSAKPELNLPQSQFGNFDSIWGLGGAWNGIGGYG